MGMALVPEEVMWKWMSHSLGTLWPLTSGELNSRAAGGFEGEVGEKWAGAGGIGLGGGDVAGGIYVDADGDADGAVDGGASFVGDFGKDLVEDFAAGGGRGGGRWRVRGGERVGAQGGGGGSGDGLRWERLIRWRLYGGDFCGRRRGWLGGFGRLTARRLGDGLGLRGWLRGGGSC